LKTKTLKKDKVNIITMGCAKNLVDSEVILTQLKGNNIDASHEKADDANIVIINTCGFIDSAKQESIDTILEYAQAKDDGLIEKLYVSGCLSERYREDLEKEIPSVDAFFGTREVPELLGKLKANYKQELLGERIITTTSHYAYLKISEGCDRPCSFCAIPLMRGKHVSVPIETLVSQAKNLAANGVKELLIIAQDSTYYGLDLYGERVLAKLLTALAEVDGIEWIRLHYAFPSGFPEDILEVMANNSKICNYLDIPLQHGSSKMLKSMRRGIDREKTEKLIQKIRKQVPGIAIRTTLIAGYPDETEEDFQEMMTFVREMRFERLGVFTYSHEENTHAFTLDDNVPEDVKTARAEELMEMQQEISLELNQEKIGTTQKVLIDRLESGTYYARTEFDSPEVDNEVLIDATDTYLRIGDMVTVKITDATEFDLTAQPL
jgi:ribosomal protein S12 methylthiotransferase